MAILLRGGARDWGQVLRGLAEFRNPLFWAAQKAVPALDQGD
jgi:hypothetical protein